MSMETLIACIILFIKLVLGLLAIQKPDALNGLLSEERMMRQLFVKVNRLKAWTRWLFGGPEG